MLYKGPYGVVLLTVVDCLDLVDDVFHAGCEIARDRIADVAAGSDGSDCADGLDGALEISDRVGRISQQQCGGEIEGGVGECLTGDTRSCCAGIAQLTLRTLVADWTIRTLRSRSRFDAVDLVLYIVETIRVEIDSGLFWDEAGFGHDVSTTDIDRLSAGIVTGLAGGVYCKNTASLRFDIMYLAFAVNSEGQVVDLGESRWVTG